MPKHFCHYTTSFTFFTYLSFSFSSRYFHYYIPTNILSFYLLQFKQPKHIVNQPISLSFLTSTRTPILSRIYALSKFWISCLQATARQFLSRTWFGDQFFGYSSKQKYCCTKERLKANKMTFKIYFLLSTMVLKLSLLKCDQSVSEDLVWNGLSFKSLTSQVRIDL